MAELRTPNVLAAANFGYEFGNKMRQDRQRQQENALVRGLAPAAMAGDASAMSQIATVSPEAAGQYEKAGSAIFNKAAGAAQFVLEALDREGSDPREVQARYSAVLPMLTTMGQAQGKTPPPELDPQMIPAMRHLVAMKNLYGGEDLKSLRVGANGNFFAIRGGQLVDTGIAAQPDNQIIPVRQADGSFQYQSVNKGVQTPYATPVGVGAPVPNNQSPAGVADGTRAISDFKAFGPDGTPITDPEVLAAVQAAAMQQTPQASSNGVLTGAAPPVSVDEQNKQARRMTAEEVKAAGYRPGTIVQVDGYGNEKVVQQPDQSSQSMSAAERKNILAAKAKVPQLQNAIRGLGRIDQALAALNMPGVNTGPLDQYVVRNTEAGQELEAAVGGIQNSFLALTRVPGIGSQSDLEARIASLQYPSLDKAPEVNRRTMENLKLFARDLAKAYEAAVTQGAGENNPDADGTPEPGAEQDGYRFIGGDPADPSSWEPL